MIAVTLDDRALKVAIDGLQGRIANMRPARPFLGLAEQAKSEIEDIIRRHVAGGVGGA